MKTRNNNRSGRFMALLVALLAAVVPALAADDIFAALAGMPHVESTYVSGRFSHNKKNWYSSDGKHAMDLRNGFSALYSYSCYSEESVRKAREILKNYIRRHPEMEVMMKTVQGSQEYVIYESFISENKVNKMIIWNCDASNVAEIVVIDWDNGIERNSGARSCIDGCGSVFRDLDLSGLENLDLSGLESLDLSGLESWGEELGRELGESILGSLSGFGKLNINKPGMQ